jgi:hypothetical protein
MSKIKTSLLGRLIGLTHDNSLQVGKGIVIGEHGKQLRLKSPAHISYFDDFLGDTLGAEWNYVEGTDSATSDGAVLAGGIGGVVRLTTGDAGTGEAADFCQLTQFLQWQASNGGLAMQARVKLSRITNAYLFIGFTDLTTLEAPIVSAASADTLTTNASDAVGFMFDTRMTTDTFHLVGVAANVDATRQAVSNAPVADRYATFRVEVTADGKADFFINGIQVGTRMTGALTAATDLTPTIMVGNTSGTTAFTAEIDYVHVTMDRGLDGTATGN